MGDLLCGEDCPHILLPAEVAQPVRLRTRNTIGLAASSLCRGRRLGELVPEKDRVWGRDNQQQSRSLRATLRRIASEINNKELRAAQDAGCCVASWQLSPRRKMGEEISGSLDLATA